MWIDTKAVVKYRTEKVSANDNCKVGASNLIPATLKTIANALGKEKRIAWWPIDSFGFSIFRSNKIINEGKPSINISNKVIWKGIKG